MNIQCSSRKKTSRQRSESDKKTSPGIRIFASSGAGTGSKMEGAIGDCKMKYKTAEMNGSQTPKCKDAEGG